MTDAVTPLTTLTPLGDSTAAFCEGDACLLPAHQEHAIVARRLDEDAV